MDETIVPKSARYRYVVLGAGRQGTAAAYDLAAFGDAAEVVLADADALKARKAAARVARLLGRRAAPPRGAAVDAASPASLARLLRGADGALCALPYRLNPLVAAAAVRAGTHYADLGCHLETTRAVLALDKAAKKAGVTLIPDCGLAPGLGTALAVRGIESLDRAREAVIYVGGLPQRPLPPLGYKVVYALESMLALYLEPAVVLRRGRIERKPPLSESERVDFGTALRLEARLTGGGTSTCPWSFHGRLRRFEYKTLRYEGHFEKMEAIRDLGLLDEEPLSIGRSRVAPRALFLRLAAERLALPEERDLVALRVLVRGRKNGRATEITYDLLDYEDPKTGFSAMERTTGFSAAAALHLQAAGAIRPAGAIPFEKCVPAERYLLEIRRRGLRIRRKEAPWR
ncbi:MAG: saccharopine dehydrogenase NADP-binding domain-containing protein [Elusimicrobia bacterium]|nr:saccharopine dehydrogenase NADP-binding domain-containing protein [Elusimicrobiota bacterium]